MPSLGLINAWSTPAIKTEYDRVGLALNLGSDANERAGPV